MLSDATNTKRVMKARTLVIVTADRSLVCEAATAAAGTHVRIVETTCDPERAIDAAILFDPDAVLVDLMTTEPRVVMRLAAALDATLGVRCVYASRPHVPAPGSSALLRGSYLRRPVEARDLVDTIERATTRAAGRGVEAVLDEFENLTPNTFQPAGKPGQQAG